MNRKVLRRGAAIVAVSGAGIAIAAGAVVPASSQTDELLELGAYLAPECLSCHQLNQTADGLPSIVGWPVETFVEVLKAYKRGARRHAIMGNVARSLDEEEMRALAIFYHRAGTGEQ